MRQFLMLIFFIVLSTIGICQTQLQYVNSAREKIKNKSWECVKACTNDKCRTIDQAEHYITYFKEEENNDWVGKKYKGLYKYSVLQPNTYKVDSINRYVRNSGPSDEHLWIFIDSNTQKPGVYIKVSRSPLNDDERDNQIPDTFSEIALLSDTEYVESWEDRFGHRRAYYRSCDTKPEFFLENKGLKD